MADPLDGLNRETLANARSIQDAMADIASSASRLQRDLRGVDGNVAGLDTKFRTIRTSVSKVAQIQEDIVSSSKAASKALTQQRKNLGEVRILSLAIDKLFVAANNNTGETRENLLRQAQNLSDAKDSAQMLANDFGRMAASASALNKESLYFDALGEVLGKLSPTFSAPFEAAATAAREQALQNANIRSEQETIAEILADSSFKYTQAELERLGLTKITGKEAGTAAKQMLKSYKDSAKTQSTMLAGAKQLKPVFTNALKPLTIVTVAAKAIEFMVNLLVVANTNMISIAKNLGISRSQAEGIRQEFIQIAKFSDNVLVNSESLLEAQSQLVNVTGAVTAESINLAESQVFFTKNLGMAAQNAGELQLLFAATGKEGMNLFDVTQNISNAQARQTGILINAQDIFREISGTSADILGYYGFQADELAEAVRQTRRLGLNLTSASKISEGLLDFESSIRNEIQAELFLGRELNFERARALALQGDFAGATEQVVGQLTNLTDAQRRNPIIMQAAAAAANTTVEELNRSFLIQNKLNKAQRDYVAQLRAGGNEVAANMYEEKALQGANTAEIMRTLTAQDKFNAALAKAKDQFTGLVDGGVLDNLADLVVDITNYLNRLFGNEIRSNENRLSRIEERTETVEKQYDVKRTPEYTALKDEVTELQKQAILSKKFSEAFKSGGYMTFGAGVIQSILSRFKSSEAAEGVGKLDDLVTELETEGVKRKTETLDDFIIRPGQPTQKFDKGDLVIGGTNLMGGGSNKRIESLLEKLVGAVQSGGNVFIDGNKAGRAMVLGSHKLS